MAAVPRNSAANTGNVAFIGANLVFRKTAFPLGRSGS
jgi:hypothetical protein